VRAAPLPSATAIATITARGITFANDTAPACTWNRDMERPQAPRGCAWTESGYEVAALGVFERRGGWLRLSLDDQGSRFGWVQAEDDVLALDELLGTDEHLTYMTRTWNRIAYDAPGPAGVRSARPARGVADRGGELVEVPYRALDRTMVGDRLWLHVELLDQVCGSSDPKVVDVGWVPAESDSGELWAWFRSRGC
jgi:hypothetical protein